MDLAIDFTASFEAAFEKKSYNLYQDLIPHMNTHSMIIGLYLYFKKSTILTRFDLNQRKLLDGIFIRKYLEQNGYQLIENGEEYTLEMGKNVDEFYHDGDRIITHLDIYNR